MLGWNPPLKDCFGTVYFRGSIMPPRIDNFPQFSANSLDIRPLKADAKLQWTTAELVHPKWGTATAMCLRNFAPHPGGGNAENMIRD